MHGIVQPPVKSVDAKLLVAFVESREQCLANVRFAVAVGVLGVEQYRCGCHQHAFSPRHHSGGKRKAVEKDGRFVIAAVAVAVGHQPHAAAVFAFVVHPYRVVGHLRDPQFTVRSPVERHRIAHQGLGDDQLQFETLRHMRRRHRLRRRERLHLNAATDLLLVGGIGGSEMFLNFRLHQRPVEKGDLVHLAAKIYRSIGAPSEK